MAAGLMERYENAQQPTPTLIYTDRDCCNYQELNDCRSKYQRLFAQWDDLEVRLDSWHFIRRLSKMCSNESHPLYGTFMTKLSAAIFEWDESDVDLLLRAKKSELVQNGASNPSPSAVRKVIPEIHYTNDLQ